MKITWVHESKYFFGKLHIAIQTSGEKTVLTPLRCGQQMHQSVTKPFSNLWDVANRIISPWPVLYFCHLHILIGGFRQCIVFSTEQNHFVISIFNYFCYTWQLQLLRRFYWGHWPNKTGHSASSLQLDMLQPYILMWSQWYQASAWIIDSLLQLCS